MSVFVSSQSMPVTVKMIDEYTDAITTREVPEDLLTQYMIDTRIDTDKKIHLLVITRKKDASIGINRYGTRGVLSYTVGAYTSTDEKDGVYAMYHRDGTCMKYDMPDGGTAAATKCSLYWLESCIADITNEYRT